MSKLLSTLCLMLITSSLLAQEQASEPFQEVPVRASCCTQLVQCDQGWETLCCRMFGPTPICDAPSGTNCQNVGGCTADPSCSSAACSGIGMTFTESQEMMRAADYPWVVKIQARMSDGCCYTTETMIGGGDCYLQARDRACETMRLVAQTLGKRICSYRIYVCQRPCCPSECSCSSCCQQKCQPRKCRLFRR